MRLEDSQNLISLRFDQGFEAISGACADGVCCHVVIQNWIDDDGVQAVWVGDDVLPCPGGWIMYAFDGDCRRHDSSVIAVRCVMERFSRVAQSRLLLLIGMRLMKLCIELSGVTRRRNISSRIHFSGLAAGCE